jgi:signal transduction histidine kinase
LVERAGFFGEAPSRREAVEAFRLLWLGLVAFAMAWTGLRLTREMTGTAAIWIADPFLLAAILHAPRRRWASRLGVGMLAYWAANLAFSDNIVLSGLLPLCNGVGLVAAAVPLRRRHGDHIDVGRAQPLVDFCLFAGLVAPAVSATLAAIVLKLFVPVHPLVVWKSWFLADALGILAIGPLLLGIRRPDLAALAAPGRRRDVLTVTIVVVAADTVAFGQDLYPVPYLILPTLVLAAFRTGFAGAVLASVLTCAIALALTLSGHGPFAPTAALDVGDQATLLQLLLAIGILTTLPVASVLAARDALNRDLRVAIQRVEASSYAKSKFLASMSHELRTPLNAVIGFAELLLLPRELPAARQRQYVQDILQSGHQLLTMVTDVLDFAQIEKGDLRLLIETIPVDALIEELAATMGPIAEAKGLGFTADPLPAGLPDIAADRWRLLQILRNLVSNAIKYNRPGGTVRIGAAAAEDGIVRLTVEDTGIGIPMERQAALFLPFDRLGAEAGTIEGAGLGLSICYHLAQLMAGAIAFTSTPGAGSVFWIDLPAALPDAGEQDAAAELFAEVRRQG